MEMTLLKVSGYFKTEPGTDKNSATFNDIVLKIPHRNEELLIRDAKRMFPIAAQKDKALKDKRFEGLCRLDIDYFEDIEGKPLCVGKDIKEMSWEELQSLACYLNIREIKLYKDGPLRAAREHAYMMYQSKVMKKKVFKNVVELMKFEESEIEKGRRLGLDDYEIQEKIATVKESAHNMITDPENPRHSYNFAKLPPIIIEDTDKKEDK